MLRRCGVSSISSNEDSYSDFERCGGWNPRRENKK